MRTGERELQLRVTGAGEEAEDRAVLIVDRLAGVRPLTGRCPAWRVIYKNIDNRGALKQLEADLTAIDPSWVEVLDFVSLPSRPLSEAEFN
jgi:hypothetical protein